MMFVLELGVQNHIKFISVISEECILPEIGVIQLLSYSMKIKMHSHSH